MTSLALKNFGFESFDRFFGIMIAVSAGVHVFAFITTLIIPPFFSDKPPKENVIQIEMLVPNLPKGPNIGTQAPSKNVTAARTPDHSKPGQKKKVKTETMAMKKKAPKVKSHRLNYKERKLSSAIDNIRKLKDAKTGGGGTGKQSGGNVFSVYMSRVQRRLQTAWTLPPGLSGADKSKKVRCRIKISSSGAITSYYVIKSSGLPHLDKSALAAISAVGTVPPPPPLAAKELGSKGMSVTFDPMVK
jgi:TonB family protein